MANKRANENLLKIINKDQFHGWLFGAWFDHM